EKIWKLLAQGSRGNYPSWSRQSPAAFVAQLKRECVANLQKEELLVKRESALARQRSQIRKVGFAAGAFLTPLFVSVFGMAYNTNPSVFPVATLAGLVAAGATGGLVRALLGGDPEIDPRISLLFGAIAGFVVGLAYLIPQWVGAPGALEAKSNAVTAT